MSTFDPTTESFFGRDLERFAALGWKPEDDLREWLIQQAEGAEKLGAMLGAEANRTLAQKRRADKAMTALRALVNGASGLGPVLTVRGTCIDSDGRCHSCGAAYPVVPADHANDCPWVAAVALVDSERSAK